MLLVHQFFLGKTSDDSKSSLSRYLAYLRGADPVFLAALEKKYGLDSVKALLHLSPTRRKKISVQEKELFHLLILKQKFGRHRDDN
jgi:hypothetical protein